MNHENDASYKTLFSAPEVVRDLILGFIPGAWLHRLDYRTLERVSDSFLGHRPDIERLSPPTR